MLFFLSCKFCIFTAHGVGNKHFANFAKFWKTSGNGWLSMGKIEIAVNEVEIAVVKLKLP